MTVKQRLLTILENNKGNYLSGRELADSLSVSRNAVWKAVKALQGEEYEIKATRNKGYCLSEDSDILSAQSIYKYLNGNGRHFRIDVLQKVSSTNRILKELAVKGEQEGRVIIAQEQSAGRGRMNKSFYSPAKTGVYMSILLRPKIKADKALFITTSAAVAAAEAIEKISGCKAEIKWVNDIFCDKKKVCGILTEASLDLESGGMEYAVLGIGMNILKPEGGFPEEISDIASAIFNDDSYHPEAKSKLIAEFLMNFRRYYKNIEQKTFLSEYKRRSFLIGKEITVFGKGYEEKALAIGIDDECCLIVKDQEGKIKTLSSGEVSTKIE